jgi:uncharacterized phage protein (TIGR01671 family)
MREIKFRAWDVGEMYYMVSVGYPANPTVYIEHKGWVECTENVVVMQYMGLKDVNKKEIYEGDIAKWDGEIWEIVWFYHGYALANEDGRCMMSDNLNVIVDDSLPDVEVIGNIYESPELLREGK